MSNCSDPVHHFVSLPEVLGQIAAELGFLERATGAIEAAINDVMTRTASHSQEVLRDLQNLDLVKQSLAAIATYTQELQRHCPAETHVDSGSAAHLVTLAALARRLRLGGIDPHTENFAADDLELFG